MKKRFMLMLMLVSCIGVVNAQFVVDDKGRTAIGYERSDTLRSLFSIKSRGKKDTTVDISSVEETGLRLLHGKHTTKTLRGLHLHNSGQGSSLSYGLYSVMSGTNMGRRIGVYGTTTGSIGDGDYDYGVAGRLTPDVSANGAAIYGISLSSSNILNPITGLYAGYFSGDVRVTGTLTAGTVVTSSDYRLKDNIRSLSSSDGCLGKLMSMNVVEFNNKQREYEVSERDLEASAEELEAMILEADSTATLMNIHQGTADGKARWYEEDSPIINNKHYGLIAQELQEIYPDLVVESQDGFLAINYLEIIPLLIRSVQELKTELDATKNANAPIKKAAIRSTADEAIDIDAVATTLYQNEPNPFTESTLIQCDVAEDVINADLYIYDMNGKQIAVYPIAQRGATSITIEGESLEAGMYLYALIADGKVIDTKRMILTK